MLNFVILCLLFVLVADIVLKSSVAEGAEKNSVEISGNFPQILDK